MFNQGDYCDKKALDACAEYLQFEAPAVSWGMTRKYNCIWSVVTVKDKSTIFANNLLLFNPP